MLVDVRMSPSELTLPTHGFHYDPLITVLDENGEKVWLDLRDFEAVSSNPAVATVDERVRITTGEAGQAVISLRHRTQPTLTTKLSLRAVEESVREVRLKGETSFSLPVGGSTSIEVEAVLAGGEVIPHAEYSSDLEVLQGGEYATFVDGLGLVTLRPTSGEVPITVGFFQRGAVASAVLSVREVPIMDLDFRLGGLSGSPLLFPIGYRSLLEVFAIYEDGSRKALEHGADYAVFVDDGFTFQSGGSANGCLFAAGAEREATLQIRLLEATARRSERNEFRVEVRSVEAGPPRGFKANFAYYPEDPRLLLAPDGSGYCRELKLEVDFPRLSGYRLSALDSVELDSKKVGVLERSANGWPVLEARRSGLDDRVVFKLPTGLSASLPICSGKAKGLRIGYPGARGERRLNLELGKTVGFTTMVDYGDGRGFVARTLDYPVVEAGAATSLPRAFWHPSPNSSNFLLVEPDQDVILLQTIDARRRPLESQEGPCRLELEVRRQSGLVVPFP